MNSLVNVITPPNLFIPSSGHKFLLVGPGEEWKDHIIDAVLELDTQRPTTLYYSDGMTPEELTWNLYTANMVDTILVNVEEGQGEPYIALAAALAHKSNVHLCIPDSSLKIILATVAHNPIEDHYGTQLQAILSQIVTSG